MNILNPVDYFFLNNLYLHDLECPCHKCPYFYMKTLPIVLTDIIKEYVEDIFKEECYKCGKYFDYLKMDKIDNICNICIEDEILSKLYLNINKTKHADMIPVYQEAIINVKNNEYVIEEIRNNYNYNLSLKNVNKIYTHLIIILIRYVPNYFRISFMCNFDI